jgi:uncharacterized membrane protein YjjB (DUF3815 family)
MNMVLEFLLNFSLSFVATVGFAVIFNAPRRELINCGITGAVGWVIYHYVVKKTGDSTMASLFGSMAASAGSRMLAYSRQAPSTLFLIPGIIPLVPGYFIYNLMLSLTEKDFYKSYVSGVGTLQIAAAIAIGIVVVFTLPYSFFALIKPKKNKGR